MSELVLKLINSSSSGLRGTTDAAGNPAFSLFDLGNVACNKERDSTYGKTNFYRLSKEGSEYKNEIDTFCIYLKVPGSGQRKTPCAGIRGLQRYLMILGGKVAAEFREIIEGTFTRVMAGDQSLIEVINANAASQGPVQQAYRAGLAQEPVAPGLDEFCLGRKREREDRLFDMEMQERQQKLEEARLEREQREEDARLEREQREEDARLERAHKSALFDQNLAEKQQSLVGARLEQVQKSATFLQSLKGMAGVDERTKMQLEDYTKNVLFNKLAVVVAGSGGGPVDEPSPATNQMNPINISIVAKNMADSTGINLTDTQIQLAGREMAKAYRKTYNTNPPQHKQFIKGNYIPVNSYTERDRPMMEEAIRAVAGRA
jgi:hypothetical protein